jgi:hypothetical protein
LRLGWTAWPLPPAEHRHRHRHRHRPSTRRHHYLDHYLVVEVHVGPHLEIDLGSRAGRPRRTGLNAVDTSGMPPSGYIDANTMTTVP